jgi:hypothetical protein
VSASLFGAVAEEGIKQIPLNDRIFIKSFFDHAIKNDQIAHVLFFENKPACLVAVILKHRNKPYSEIIHLKGWRSFKRYEHFFPHPNFIFSENVVKFDEDFKVLHIYMINKQSFVKCLEQNLLLFKQELGEEFSSEIFISCLENGASLPALLRHDEMLLGLLLGFGEESSRIYKEIDSGHLTAPFFKEPQFFDLKRPQGCKIAPIAFMGDPNSKEVQKLGAIYEGELEKFWKRYKATKNPLKMIFQQLCEQRN